MQRPKSNYYYKPKQKPSEKTLSAHIATIMSDGRVQYASTDSIKELALYVFQISMSRKGNLYENAYAESFIKSLISEEVHMWEYRTIKVVQRRIPNFIEEVYNHKRLQCAISYRPP